MISRWIFALLCLSACAPASAKPTLDDLWRGKAHLEQVGELSFGQDVRGRASETASWFVARHGVWFAFSRANAARPASLCKNDHMQVVVRESRDKGRSWSSPVVAASPGISREGDGCAILDGSSFYDQASGTWHLLAQCLDVQNRGGWSLCHYSRRSQSPLGAFAPDPANPVVRGGQLWSRLCGPGRACPAGIVDEGTPDIVAKRPDGFLVTIHGYHPASRAGFRAVIATPDFRRWTTSGGSLPGTAILSARDCAGWLPGCVGFGQASTVFANGRIYLVAESMDRGLGCVKNQRWVFAIMRSRTGAWPRSNGGWDRLPDKALIHRKWPDANTSCALSYARWLVDGSDVYLIYEDWEPNHARLHRRLLKLVPGGGRTLKIP